MSKIFKSIRSAFKSPVLLVWSLAFGLGILSFLEFVPVQAHNTGGYHAHNTLSRLFVPSFLVQITLKSIKRHPAMKKHYPGEHVRCLGVVSSLPGNMDDRSVMQLVGGTGWWQDRAAESGNAPVPPLKRANHQIMTSASCIMDHEFLPGDSPPNKSFAKNYDRHLDLNFFSEGLLIQGQKGFDTYITPDFIGTMHPFHTFANIIFGVDKVFAPVNQRRGSFNLNDLHHKKVYAPRAANFLKISKPAHRDIKAHVVTLDATSSSHVIFPKSHKIQVYYPEPGPDLFLERFPALRNTSVAVPNFEDGFQNSNAKSTFIWFHWHKHLGGGTFPAAYISGDRLIKQIPNMYTVPNKNPIVGGLGAKDRHFRNGIFLGKIIEGDAICGGDEGAPVFTDYSQGTGVPHVIGIITDIFVDRTIHKKDGSYRCGTHFLIKSIRSMFMSNGQVVRDEINLPDANQHDASSKFQ